MNISKPGMALAIGLAAALSGCGDVDVGERKNGHTTGEDKSAGTMLGGVTLFGAGTKQESTDSNTGLAVNAYLWRGTLDTLKFMPLTSADPFGGVIITDWWTPATSPNERFKATAYILGRQLRADGVHVSLFRQVLQNGQWLDAPVDPGKPAELENMALAKARELRSQAAPGT